MNPNQGTPRQHAYHSSHDFRGTPSAPGINVQYATPRETQYATMSPGTNTQAAGRPSAPSSAMGLSNQSLPSLPSPNASQTSTRLPLMGQAHSYSRSSPAGMDPKFAGSASTPESSKFTSTPTHKHTISQNLGESIYSPLGLADIRSMGDSMGHDMQSGLFGMDGQEPAQLKNHYSASWPIYAFDWCKWPIQNQQIRASAGKMAIGSYVEDGHNFIQILETSVTAECETDAMSESPQHGLDYTKVAEATHSYPVTRILWEPASSQKQSTDLLATSGDHLRLWSLPSQVAMSGSNSITRPTNSNTQPVAKLDPLALLSNSKSPEHTAPLTSLDWNTVSPSLIITSSIDTTCTIWDIPTLTAKTQLIAHDKEVFDVRFCANSVDVFVSCGADGSVRMFDLRSLEHSTIIYEPSEKNSDPKAGSPAGSVSPTRPQQGLTQSPPLLRLAASPHDSHLLATFSQDSTLIRILDVRQPGQALLELRGHAAPVNCIEWSPSRRGTLASGGDDSLVLLWDLLNQQSSTRHNPVAGSVGSTPGHSRHQSSSNFSNPHSRHTSISNNIAGNGLGSGTAIGGATGSTASAGSGEGNLKSLTPSASWRCDFEVGNISWAPQSGLIANGPPGSDWLGVTGGRGIWGVSMYM